MGDLTEKQCLAKGWNWNPKTETCTRPKIGKIVMTVGRGSGCDGKSRKEKTKGSAISADCRDAMLRDAAKNRK